MMHPKKLIKNIIGSFLMLTGISYLISNIFFKNRNIIICYHKPAEHIFRSHLGYIVKHYKIIPLSFLVEAIEKNQYWKIPPKSIVITFDDGWKENYTLLKIIEEFKIPVTIYLNSHIVGTNRKFWWNSGGLNFDKLKQVSNEKRLLILKEKLKFDQNQEYSEAQALNIQQLKEMAPLIDFQSHGCYHPILTECKDSESLKEIRESKNLLEQMLGKSIEHFSYPNGNFGKRELAFLKETGYKSGVTLGGGWNNPNSNIFCLSRIWVSDEATVNELVGQLSGVFQLLRRFYRTIKLFGREKKE